MRSFAGLLTVLAVAAVRVSALNVFVDSSPVVARGDPTCPPGRYYNGNGCQACQAGYSCGDGKTSEVCKAGTYSSAGASSCTPCAAGTYADHWFGYVQAGSMWMDSCWCQWWGNRGPTSQQACGKGNYSAAGSSSCTACPPGSYCNSDTTCAPAQCQPGRYAPNAGASDCLECLPGSYVNSYGATSCCSCCAGSFNSASSQTHCQACPEMVGPDGKTKLLVTSDVGSASSGKCHAYKAGDPAPIPSSCVDSSQTLNQPTCPATSGPQPSGYRKRSLPRGCSLRLHTRCEVKTGRGGWECIDTDTTLDACGSCDNDCSAIPYAGDVKCVRGQCQLSSCRKGFVVQVVEGRPTCAPASKHAFVMFEQDMQMM